MKRLRSSAALIMLFGSLLASPVLAMLKTGVSAPRFSAPAYLAGHSFTFHLTDALKKGPVVLYFFPAPHTHGCNIEAHLFSQAIAQFKAVHASVVGITAGKLSELATFSKENRYCSGKFPVASDKGAKIARKYDARLTLIPGLSNRTSYVIAPSGKIVFAYSNLSPDQHVAKTLAAVRKLKKKAASLKKSASKSR